jgi:hypothetical protein
MLARNIDSLHSLASWLRSKDPNEQYMFADNSGCLISQYLSEAHGRPVSCNPRLYRFRDEFREGTPLPPGFNHVALPSTKDHIDHQGVSTFGAALERCEALIAGGPEALAEAMRWEYC